jgi:hypothetical protein
MKGTIIFKAFTIFSLFTAISIRLMAEKGKTLPRIQGHLEAIHLIYVDTLPPIPQNSENKSKIPEIEPIKEVPKSRRQSVPLPVGKVNTVKVIKPKIIKPKVIKPKIIKPLIKVIN